MSWMIAAGLVFLGFALGVVGTLMWLTVQSTAAATPEDI